MWPFDDEDEQTEEETLVPEGNPRARISDAKPEVGPPKSAMNPQVREYLLGKNAGPSVDDANLDVRYERLAKDTGAIDEARKGADDKNMWLGVIEGIGTMFAGNKMDGDYFSKLRAANEGKVTAAKDDHKQKLSDLLTKDKLQRQGVERGREDTEYNELNDAKSKRSDLYRGMAKPRVAQLVAEARRVSDQQGVEQLTALQQKLESGELSAADVGKMSLLDKVDYKDILNNMAAMERVRAQEGAADRRSKEGREAEDRRNTKMKFDQESNLRALIDKDPMMKQAVVTQNALDKLDALMKQPGGISDEAIIMQWQKALDPNSVVRESEFSRTQAGAGLLTRLEMMVKQAAGQGRLTDDMRRQIQQGMDALRSSHASYARNKLAIVDNAINSYGLDAKNVYGQYTTDLANSDDPAPPAQAPQDAATQAPINQPEGAKEVERLATDPATGQKRPAIFDENTKQFIRWK